MCIYTVNSNLTGSGNYSSFSNSCRIISCNSTKDPICTIYGFGCENTIFSYSCYCVFVPNVTGYASACINYNGHCGNVVNLTADNNTDSKVSTAYWTESQPYTVDCSYYSWIPV